MKSGVKKINFQGTDCWQPYIRVATPYGPITHYATGLYLTTKKDAQDTAKRWLAECEEVGQILH